VLYLSEKWKEATTGLKLRDVNPSSGGKREQESFIVCDRTEKQGGREFQSPGMSPNVTRIVPQGDADNKVQDHGPLDASGAAD